MRNAECGMVSVAAPSQRHVSMPPLLDDSRTPPRMPGDMKTLRRPEGHSAIRIPRFLANLAFKYPDQLLNRGWQTKLLACCTQTGSAQVLSLFRVQEQSSDG
jgi:hypothetical protein